MAHPIIIADTGSPSQIMGVHGGRGRLRWKRFVTGLMMHAHWDSFEHNRLDPGAAVGMHVHSRTEEVYVIIAGTGLMHYNDEQFEVGPGDLIMTPLHGKHGIVNTGSEVLEFVVVEALPPAIVNALPEYSPSAT
ncbi:MAG: cupin domain-containing protein [Microcella pacifica]|jgi:mannose-6-phosphate isomerase-like protein (cupin superfamily)|uniref:Cupin domain-containing protein n=1 Tax=Microcella pacifica TaxID=2591847 RepID=A0A9E5JQW0_9MICO|nr:cupin domain-containing protein [Microcella pacifica]MBR22888.1 cupin [Leifsonia sp.]NHF64164.1 cupin domain-containing protein [Microcella pacifica]